MKNINIFCYGFGQVAKSFINRLSLEDFNIQLSTTNRSETTLNKIGSIEYKSYKFENNKFDFEIIDKLKICDHILISIPPINGNDIVISNFSLDWVEIPIANYLEIISWMKHEPNIDAAQLSNITGVDMIDSFLGITKIYKILNEEK